MRSKLLCEKDIGSVIFRLYEDRIFHVEIKSGELVTMSIVEEGNLFIDEKGGGGKFYNLYEFKSFADVEPEVREWAASPSNNLYTYADAIIISTLPQKILANFYIGFNKPVKPTKIFTSIDKAYNWLIEVSEKETIEML